MQETLRLIPIRTFSLSKIARPLPFDLYIKLGPNKFTKVFNAQTELDITRFEGYVLKGIEHFYIPETNRNLFLEHGIGLLKELRNAGDFSRDEAREILDEVTEQCLNDIYAKLTLTAETEKALSFVVEVYVEIIKEQSHLLPALVLLARKKADVAKHAVMTSIFSTLLARAQSPGDDRLAFVCAYAGLLHDIGFAVLKTTDDEHNLGLSGSQLKEIQKHPVLSAQLVGKATALPQEIQTAILQHHEGYDGSGYPQGLRGDKISLAARIVSIADEFVALITGSGSNFPLPPNLAVHALSKNTHLDPYLFATFTRLLKF